MKELQDLMNDISEWSDKTFGESQRNPAIVYHLKKEVNELIDGLVFLNDKMSSSIDVNKVGMEYADCFILLLDSAHHFGLSAENLISLSREKLEINKKCKWGIPDENGVVEHIK